MKTMQGFTVQLHASFPRIAEGWCAGVQEVELTGYSIYQWLKKYMVSLNFNFPAWYPVGSTCKEPSCI
jgi:hypothetical protein